MDINSTNIEKLIKVEIHTSANRKKAFEEYKTKFSTDSIYENHAEYDKIYEKYLTTIEYTNKSVAEVNALVEPMRIADPDCNINISWNFDSPNGLSFIANTSWNDQMSMYPQYEVYTPEGFRLKVKALKQYHAKLIEWGNWNKDYTYDQYYNEVMENQSNLVQLEAEFLKHLKTL